MEGKSFDKKADFFLLLNEWMKFSFSICYFQLVMIVLDAFHSQTGERETFFSISQKSEKSFSSFAHDILFFFSWICKRFFFCFFSFSFSCIFIQCSHSFLSHSLFWFFFIEKLEKRKDENDFFYIPTVGKFSFSNFSFFRLVNCQKASKFTVGIRLIYVLCYCVLSWD